MGVFTEKSEDGTSGYYFDGYGAGSCVLPLFTLVRGRGLLRTWTSALRRFKKFATCKVRLSINKKYAKWRMG